MMSLKQLLSRYTVLPIKQSLSIDDDLLEILIADYSEQLESSFEILESNKLSEVSFDLPGDKGMVTLSLIEGKVDIQIDQHDRFLFSTAFQNILEEAFNDYVSDHKMEAVLDRKFGKHQLSLSNIDEIDEMIKSIY